MIKCSVCGYDNPDDAQTCLNCGSAIEREAMGQAIDDISGEATVLIGQPIKPPDNRPPASSPSPPPPPPETPRPPAPPPPPPPPPPQAPSVAQGGQQQGWQQQYAPGGQPPPPRQQQFGQQPPTYGGGAPPAPPVDAPNPTVYIALSIAEILCCCLPLGVVALIFTIMGQQALNLGDYEKARGQFKIAKICLIIGVIGGALITLLWGIAVVLGESSNY